MFNRVISHAKRLVNRLFARQVAPDVLIREAHSQNNELVKHNLIACSIEEDENNTYYSGLLNTLSQHCVGTIPLPSVQLDEKYIKLCDQIEDKWYEWSVWNGIGASIREFRRKCAQVGMAALIPVKTDSDYDLKLGFQVVGAEYFESPMEHFDDPYVVDGVHYHPSGTVRGVWIKEDLDSDPRYYSCSKDGVIVWARNRLYQRWPECAPAFTVYPSIRRYLENIMRGEEFKTAIPMAVEMDPNVFKPQTISEVKQTKFKYEPGMIPTLPVGCKLVGLNIGAMSADREKFIELLAATAARCVDMPKVLALADSSDSNMATAHIDLQPWKYAVEIDRYDFERVNQRVFQHWFTAAKTGGLLRNQATQFSRLPVLFQYTVLFEHPDPNKRAAARALDLASGAATLTEVYADRGKNARRQILKDCKLMGISPEQFWKYTLQKRYDLVQNASKQNSSQDQSKDSKQGEKR